MRSKIEATSPALSNAQRVFLTAVNAGQATQHRFTNPYRIFLTGSSRPVAPQMWRSMRDQAFVSLDFTRQDGDTVPVILTPTGRAALGLPQPAPAEVVAATATAILSTEPVFFTAAQVESAIALWEANPDVGRDPSDDMKAAYMQHEGGTLDQAGAALYHARDLGRD